MSLIDYINYFYAGNKSEFGRAVGVSRQQVSQWIDKGFIVVNHRLYSPRRDLPEKNR
jgi:ribosomal protein L7Ae-like RNA K-turn-binding protein